MQFWIVYKAEKYCEAIMDDLLLFTPIKKSDIAKLKDLLKALLKNVLRYHQRNASSLEKNCNIWKILYLLRIGECVLNHYVVDLKLFRLKPQITVKGCRSFAGMVNFLSLFCPRVTEIIKANL